MILPATDGHPVKRVNYATEVNHDKPDRNKEEEATAKSMYKDIRLSTSDVSSISSSLGLPAFQVARIKNHLFFDDAYILSGHTGRFNLDYEIA